MNLSIKDAETPRGQYRPTIKPTTGNVFVRAHGLYIQDEACDIFIDKYGREKGIKNWEYSIEGHSGKMFAMCQTIINEKYAMCEALGIKLNSYFDKSYLEIWTAWKSK